MKSQLVPLHIQLSFTVKEMLDRVLRLPAVASKRYLTNKVVNKLEGMKTSTGDSVRVFKRNSLAISHELATYFPLEITPVLKEYSCTDTEKISQNLIMSVFCLNTLIFAPDC